MVDAASVQSPLTVGTAPSLWRMLWRDKFATISVAFVILLALVAIIGPLLLGQYATRMALSQRNMPPGSLDAGWLYILGADNLGRSIVARLVVGAQNTLGVAYFRAGHWRDAIAALNRSDELAPNEHLGYNAFFRAMAHWRLGETEAAQREYGRAVAWMNDRSPQNVELLRFRAEAEALLGVKAGP